MAVHYPADLNIFACVCIDYVPATPKDPAILKYALDKLNGQFIASAEDDKTLAVLIQLEQKLGQEIVWVRGKSFDQIIDEAGCLPTWNRRFCTTQMKIIPIFEYCYFRFGMVTEQIGFRYDELWRAFIQEDGKIEYSTPGLFGAEVVKAIKERRLFARNEKAIMKYPVSVNLYGDRQQNWEKEIHWANKTYPMIDDKVDRKAVNDYWLPFVEFDFPDDGNCKGCHHKNKGQIKANWKTSTPQLEWFSLQEKKGKYNTWHDDQVTYDQIRSLPLTESMFTGASCNTGYCIQ